MRYPHFLAAAAFAITIRASSPAPSLSCSTGPPALVTLTITPSAHALCFRVHLSLTPSLLPRCLRLPYSITSQLPPVSIPKRARALAVFVAHIVTNFHPPCLAVVYEDNPRPLPSPSHSCTRLASHPYPSCCTPSPLCPWPSYDPGRYLSPISWPSRVESSTLDERRVSPSLMLVSSRSFLCSNLPTLLGNSLLNRCPGWLSMQIVFRHHSHSAVRHTPPPWCDVWVSIRSLDHRFLVSPCSPQF